MVYLAVRNRIVEGRYLPGARIRESDLRHEFGTSNGPVREALQLAGADGLVEREPFRGVRVIDLSPAEIRDVFEVRRILLGAAAELAARRAPADIANRARHFKERFIASIHGGEAARLPGELSKWVFDIVGNARLTESYRRPLLQSLVYVNAVLNRRRPQPTSLDEHVVALVDAIASRDSNGAREAAYRLTDETLRQLGLPVPDDVVADSA